METRPRTCWLATLTVCVCQTALAAGAASADWKPAPVPLLTRWAREVTPDNAWREYPRPQMVRTEWQSLNGLWDYAVVGEGGEWKQPNVENAAFDPLAKGAPALPQMWAGKILVPFAIESALSGAGRQRWADAASANLELDLATTRNIRVQ